MAFSIIYAINVKFIGKLTTLLRFYVDLIFWVAYCSIMRMDDETNSSLLRRLLLLYTVDHLRCCLNFVVYVVYYVFDTANIC